MSKVGFAAVMALLLSSCATYQPVPIDAVATAEKFSARRIDGPELRESIERWLPGSTSEWPLVAWNRGQLLAAALVLNPRLAIARSQLRAALAHEITAGQAPNPETTLQTEYARHDPHPWLYGLSFDLLLRTPQRKRLDIELARVETSAVRWDLMNEAWSVRRELIAALSERESAARRLALLDRLIGAATRRVDLERRRVAAGEDAADELFAAQQAEIESDAQRAEARSDHARTDAALAAAIGVAPPALAQISADWPEWGGPPAVADATLTDSREQSLRTRSDLAAAIDSYAAAENRLQQAVLRQYPQIHLSPGYYWDHGVSKFPFNVGFDLPLFNRNEGEIAEARAARELAGQRMLALQAEIIGSIAAAQRGEDVARGNVAVAQLGLESARGARERSAASLRLGAVGAVDDLAAERIVLLRQLELVQMKTRLQAARNALEDALHAPLSGPELDLARSIPAMIAGGAK